MTHIKLSEKNKDFFSEVYAVAQLIPKGRATSYGSIARYLGRPRGARMVGWAMNASFKPDLDVPAHRVVNRNGLLTGKAHFTDPNEMQRRLEEEGIAVKKDQIQQWDEVYWDPSENLTL